MPIIFPDVELWACGAISAALASRSETYAQGVKVGNAVPSPLPTRFVWVRRDGGPVRDGLLEDPRIGVNVFAATEQDATDLALLVSALFRDAADGKPVTAIRQSSGPSPIADESRKPRRYMTFQLTVRGAEL